METHTTIVAGVAIIINSSPNLTAQANWLCGVVEAMHRRGAIIQENVRFQLGWSVLSFRSQGDGALVVCEPDYFGNPFQDELRSVDVTLEVQSRQNEFAARLGVTPVLISFQDKIVVAKGVLNDSMLYMERGTPCPEKNDSGWYIGKQGQDNGSPELEGIYAFQLLREQPHLFNALILPAGYVVFANEHGIERIFDSENKLVFS
jgi:hypothetical protein